VVDALTRRFGDLDIAEEAARDHRPKCGQRGVDRLPNVTIPPHRLPPVNSASRYRRSAPMCRYSARKLRRSTLNPAGGMVLDVGVRPLGGG
jgi:hypothetical protein